MATYNNFSDVADKAEFLEFIKTEFGIDDVAKISPIEQQAMFYKFKSHEGDLSDADIAFLKEIDNANKPEDMEALAKAQYDKSLSGLTADEKIFVSVKAYEAADKGVSVDEMVTELAKKPAQKEAEEKKKRKAKTKQDEPQVTQQNDDTEYHRDLLYRDFLDLSAIKYLEEDATRARREDMDAFVAKKDSFIKSHPEMETEVNNQLDDFVKTEGNEIMWKGEPYRIQDEFKKYYMERFHPEKKSEKEQKNKETKVATQEAVEAGSAQVIVAFRSREELFDAFHKLGAEIEVSGIGTAKQQVKVSDIHDFVARKEGYFETHAAERDEINGQIDDFLKQDYVVAEGYGWTYAPSDEFREIYKKVSADYAAANTGKGGKGGKDNGGKGQKPELQTIVIGGNGGNDNGGKGGKGQKPELQTVMVGGNGGNDNGGAQIPPQQQ
ncbi:MAG: hypothetical protein IKR92_05080, partial [Alphaproteobacteria bacterium]|nr:hypothetical protein [Alphaproteobacteria bacterium]